MFRPNDQQPERIKLIIDDFLSEFNELRAHCDGVDFAGMTNPVDGVFYPGVSNVFPEGFEDRLTSQLETLFGRDIDINALFMRMSSKGVEAPHYAHTDSVMGDWALMLYLNRPGQCQGGTAFLSHKATGMKSDPVNENELSAWKEDTNNPEAWLIRDLIIMETNRALVFSSNQMHAAYPHGGFGENNKDSRLVLTCFFNLK